MAETNPNSRLETFCDGVFAIALTLLILDVRIPLTTDIQTTADLWLAIVQLTPAVFAFVLSFIIILITWVNHHTNLKLVDKSSPSFIYTNGFLLLTVVFLPFPTGLLGQYLLTDHSVPAVVLYDATLAFQAVGWILLTSAALKDKLYKSGTAEQTMRMNNKFGYFSLPLYTLCAITALWLPLAIAIVTTLSWVFWLIYSINIRHEEID